MPAMSPVPLEIVVLAAGKGTRMRSARSKVLHEMGGEPLVLHVLQVARSLAPQAIHVVVGYDAPAVAAAIAPSGARAVPQGEPRGTGHAVQCALRDVHKDAVVLVLYGDVPLVEVQDLAPLVDSARSGALALLTAHLTAPQGYGRIVRDKGRIVGIVEERDASVAERAISEVNTGMLAAPAARLDAWVNALTCDNAQNEYYLTDIVALAVKDGVSVVGHEVADPRRILGVNSAADLAVLERLYQRKRADELLVAGARLRDPGRIDVRGTVSVGRDVVIDIDVLFEGKVTLGDGVHIGPFCHLRNVTAEAGAKVESHSVLENVHLGRDARVGPFARLRPGTVLGDHARVGNFVEIKNTVLGPESKVNHLSYVGDSEVGRDVNIGAGVITCNYDGANKHRTVIGDGAFIGSDTQLVAPVTVGPGATIGAGSTITEDAPGNQLTLSRVRQKTVPGWRRPEKKS